LPGPRRPPAGWRALMADSPASGLPFPARRRSYRLTAAVLLMLGGTLPVRPYVLYERQMGFGPLGVTVVFAAYVLGTLVALGDLSDHIARGLPKTSCPSEASAGRTVQALLTVTHDSRPRL
jgi:hypothetical protein